MTRLALLLMLLALPAQAQDGGRHGDYPVIAPPGFAIEERDDGNDYRRSWSTRPGEPMPDPVEPYRPQPRRPLERPPPNRYNPPDDPPPRPAAAPQGPTQVPPHVVFIRTAGQWKQDGREGVARVVITRPSTRQEAMRLYVQWIMLDKTIDRFALIDSKELPEMYDWRIRLDDYEIEPRKQGATVMFDGTSLLNAQKRRYRLSIGAPGDASLQAVDE